MIGFGRTPCGPPAPPVRPGSDTREVLAGLGLTQAEITALRDMVADELNVEAETDADCRALLLTGAGRGFCAGQDLNERVGPDRKTLVFGNALETYYNPLVRLLRELPFPVVAAPLKKNGTMMAAAMNGRNSRDAVTVRRPTSEVSTTVRMVRSGIKTLASTELLAESRTHSPSLRLISDAWARIFAPRAPFTPKARLARISQAPERQVTGSARNDADVAQNWQICVR